MNEIVEHPSLRPDNFELRGGVIGLDGTDIRISCEVITLSHSTEAVETTHPSYYDHRSGVGSVSGDDYVKFVGNQYVQSPVRFIGEYTGPDTAGVKTAMEVGVAIAVTMHLDEGIDYGGEIIITGASVKEARGGDKVDLDISGIFTGFITGEGSGSNQSRSPSVLLDRKLGSSYTLSIQDRQGSSATRPFVATGYSNSNVSIEHSCDAAIAAAGGVGATYPEKPWLQLTHASGVWKGRDVIVGLLHYSGDGPAGFCNKNIRVFSGFLDRKRRHPTAIGSTSGVNACDIISGFGLSVQSYAKIRRGYKIYQIPCRWDSQPDEQAYINTINADVFSLMGITRGAYTVRWDPLEEVQQHRRSDGSTYWTGYIQLSVMVEGWTDHRIHCIANVPLPTQGTQTVGGYASVYGWLQVYMYPTSSFPTLAEFCPNCAANFS